MYGRMGYLAAAIALSALALLGCAQEKAGDRTAQAKAQQPPPQTAEHQRVRDSTQSFLVAMQARQDARACRMMTHRLQHGITFFLERNAEPGNCQTRATHIYSPAKAPATRAPASRPSTSKAPQRTPPSPRPAESRATSSSKRSPAPGRSPTSD